MAELFHPINLEIRRNIGPRIVNALLKSPERPLAIAMGTLEGVKARGMFTLYPRGDFPDFPAYRGYVNASLRGCRVPIFVGTASGPLYRRLERWYNILDEVDNLTPEQFTCRYLLLDKLYLPEGKEEVRRQFMPLWNVYLKGHGNNDLGITHGAQERSRFDTVHPGRSGTRGRSRKETPRQIELKITEHMHSHYPNIQR